MRKIVTIIGARPQFIKAATVSRILKNQENIQEIIVHTGQHFDPNMSSVFFKEMGIPVPDHHLDISNLTHGAMTGRMIEKIESVLLFEKPDLVLVYGDTNSTLAGALAARKLDIRLAHIEAGLRSYNMKMPEETNRILTDRISDLLFCPTENAMQNLHKEGFSHFKCEIHLVGDVMYDAALFYGSMSAERSDVVSKMGLREGKYLLCTVHRQENTDNIHYLRNIIEAFNEIHRETRVVLPLHPRTRKILEANSIHTDFDPIEPVGYFDIIELVKHSDMVITDSGGMQKEAYFFEKYCITLRDETEWTELVSGKYNFLASTQGEPILSLYHRLHSEKFCNTHSLYGDGHAAEKIISLIQKGL